jgi:hypothetical protein
MKIIDVKYYRDGGTVGLETDSGIDYYVDQRLQSNTKGTIWDGYPDKDGSSIVQCKLVYKALLGALQSYHEVHGHRDLYIGIPNTIANITKLLEEDPNV